MPLLRWNPALLALLVLMGCKKDEPAAPAPAPVAPPAAPARPAPPPAPAPPPPAAPVAGPTIAYLNPADPERCDWVRRTLPSGEPTSLFSFNAACDRSMVSWGPGAREGLVFAWPSGEGEVPRAWRVDFGAHSGKPLELKGLPGGTGAGAQDKPAIEQIGFDGEGRPVAIVMDVYVSRKPKKGAGGKAFLSFEKDRYPEVEGEGLPGLALAYRLEEGGWKRIETKASTFDSDISLGTGVLDTLKALSPVIKASPSRDMPGEDVSESAVPKLDAAFPGLDESGEWKALPTPGGLLYYRGTLGGEFLYPSVPMAWEQDGKLVPLEGLQAKEGDFLDLFLQDGALLTGIHGDTRAVQVWDTRTKERLLSVEGAVAPAFWPKASAP
ncbi:hypothetical protein POL68_33605 [Stigmatella sp. ncwal1]|uniref:Uncharacterized protein n=1 Tax=Stigmatella ashevillensis TaxID=2995309 RepID=A0ABT5DIQ4_9BACT|nr:hypothetical protein [Stigmatella ashevillena]MDC0713449.1 hypothetical protein [Stigmatella ashevillena]